MDTKTHCPKCELFLANQNVRGCSDADCPCHSQDTGWEKEFDARFERDTDPNDRVNGWLRRINGNGTVSIALPKDVKAFISQLLTSQREQLATAVEGIPNVEFTVVKGNQEVKTELKAKFTKDVLALIRHSPNK